MRTTKTKTKTKNEAKYCLLANKSYGLYAGLVESFDPLTGVAVIAECRHVARWYGRTGGITSLAAHGLCGLQAGESRIGAPAPGLSTLTGVVNVFPFSAEARATIEAAKQS